MGSTNIIRIRQQRPLARIRRALIIGGLLFSGACAGIAASKMGWRPGKPDAGVLLQRAMPVCHGPRRVSCVVDGDTIWLNGEKIRLSTFNTPEVNGQCSREIALAQQATRKLSAVLSNNRFTVQRQGLDRYDRRLAVIRIDGRDVADLMIAAGLAHEWQGFRQSWC